MTLWEFQMMCQTLARDRGVQSYELARRGNVLLAVVFLGDGQTSQHEIEANGADPDAIEAEVKATLLGAGIVNRFETLMKGPTREAMDIPAFQEWLHSLAKPGDLARKDVWQHAEEGEVICAELIRWSCKRPRIAMVWPASVAQVEACIDRAFALKAVS